MINPITGFNPDYSEQAPSAPELAALPGPVLVEFGTPWCGHCGAAANAVREFMADHPQMPHIKIYDGKGKALGRHFRVKLWPTLIVLHDGVETARVVRPTSVSQLRQLLQQAGIPQ